MQENLIDLFNVGMFRNYPNILQPKQGFVLNVGPGKKPLEGTVELDWPEWDAEIDQIPYENDSVDMIECYHFLEHISNTAFVVSEFNRVLKPGSHVNIVVPYYKSQMMWQDPDHKRSFTEKTWESLFNWDAYEKGKITPMDVCTNFIMGDVEANLVLVTQLRKVK